MEHPPRTLFGTLLIMGHMLSCKESNDTSMSRIYRVSGQAGDSESSKACPAQDPGKAMFQSEYKDWEKLISQLASCQGQQRILSSPGAGQPSVAWMGLSFIGEGDLLC